MRGNYKRRGKLAGRRRRNGTGGARTSTSTGGATATGNTGAATGGAVTITTSGSSSTETSTGGAGKGSGVGPGGKARGGAVGAAERPLHITVNSTGRSGHVKKNPAELLIMGANPASAAEMAAGQQYEQFHGAAPKHVDGYHEPEPRPATLSEIGDLIELRAERFTGWKWGSLDFTGRGVKVAQNIAGTQIYFVGGNQKLTRGDFSCMGADCSKDLINLGSCRYIAYRTKKAQLDGIRATYEHGFGEETQQYPVLMYDKRGLEPRLYLIGGAYRIEARGIVN
jgi:hypothetical protein